MLSPTSALTWNAVPEAQAYYLYVGSTPGANDLINSGEMQGTAVSVLSLPRGQFR